MDTSNYQCCNCGKTFPTKKGKSIGGRKSLKSTAVINKVNKTLQDLIEEEFDIVLSPEQKRQRFLCSACSWAVVSMAKSSAAKREAMVRIKEHGELTYLAKKIRSPVPTPRKIKRMRVTSPRKVFFFLNFPFCQKKLCMFIKQIISYIIKLQEQDMVTSQALPKKRKQVNLLQIDFKN